MKTSQVIPEPNSQKLGVGAVKSELNSRFGDRENEEEIQSPTQCQASQWKIKRSDLESMV